MYSNNIIRTIFYIFIALMMVACGGGNKSTSTGSKDSGNNTTNNTSNNTPAIVDVLTSSNVIPSSGTEVLITAHVKNVSNVALSGVNVTFGTSSGNLVPVTTVTDASGVVTAKLSAGSNKSIRNITVTVSAGSVTGNVTLAVTETTVSVSGNGSLKQGGTTSTYLIKARDALNNSISGATFTVSSSLSNGLSNSSVTTDSTGNASFSYTPTNSGTDTLTVTGLGIVTKNTIDVTNVDFNFVSPVSDTQITVGTNQAVTVQYLVGSVGQAGKSVAFTTTRGTIACSPCTTDGAGQLTATLNSGTAGPATIQAQITGVGQVTLPVQFEASAPNTVVAQANPSTVQPNSGGSTTYQSTIEAVVRDINQNAVANTQIAFSLVTDLSNGVLSSGGVATTDINGRAQVQFIPGANTTANNGVVIKASAGAVSGQANLTVSGQALFINIGFGNDMTAPNTTSYSKPYSVYVTNATGGAATNQTITLKAIPIDYDKGSMNYDTATSLWVAVPTVTCVNEDTNQNGIVDTGEDVNLNGRLEPGNMVTISPTTVTTDSNGFATFNISYGKNYALWSRVRIVAQTTVAGTESSKAIDVRLPILSSDIGDQNVAPAGRTSPFGVAALCSNPN